jgi:hypothetical protein
LLLPARQSMLPHVLGDRALSNLSRDDQFDPLGRVLSVKAPCRYEPPTKMPLQPKVGRQRNAACAES